MSEPWWEDILLILLGSSLALVSQFVISRYRRAARGKVAAISLAHEMKGVAFSTNSFGGFTSEAFAGQLVEIPGDAAGAG